MYRKTKCSSGTKKDLSQAIDLLLEDIENGNVKMKTYKQMKMYNDESLNPVLYQKLKINEKMDKFIACFASMDFLLCRKIKLISLSNSFSSYNSTTSFTDRTTTSVNTVTYTLRTF
jgi:lantibiotic modifying enzyme